MTDVTTLKLTDERERLLEQVQLLFEGHADHRSDELPRSKAIDLALQTTLELHENLHEHGDEIPPQVTQKLSTKHVGVNYRTSVYPEPFDY